MWKCETRDLEVNLTGTNEDGSSCNLPLPVRWSVGNAGATIAETGPNTARLTAVTEGTTPVTAASLVGSQFSFTTEAQIETLDGTWTVTEDGEQTCVIDGEPVTEFDGGSDDVSLSAPTCDSIVIDIGLPGLDGLSGALAPTGDYGMPFTFEKHAGLLPLQPQQRDRDGFRRPAVRRRRLPGAVLRRDDQHDRLVWRAAFLRRRGRLDLGLRRELVGDDRG